MVFGLPNWDSHLFASNSPCTVVSGDAISHLVNPIDPVLLPWHLFGALPCLNTQPRWVNVAGVQGIYQVPGRSVCDERYSQLTAGSERWVPQVLSPSQISQIFKLNSNFLYFHRG